MWGAGRSPLLSGWHPVSGAPEGGGGGVEMPGEDAGCGLSEGAPEGPVLGIETSSRVGSVALAEGGVVVARRLLPEPSRHSAGLIPAIEEVLGERGLDVDELVGIAVGAGPGSFTGVKVAAAAAKGLSCSLEVPLYATSSLRAAAVAGASAPACASAPAGEESEIRYVLFDARGGRVYGACYDVGAAGVDQAIAPHGGTILDVINGRPPRSTVFMGDGAASHAALIGAAGYAVRPPPAGLPGADGVLCCCDWVAVDAASWEPEYVREWRPG